MQDLQPGMCLITPNKLLALNVPSSTATWIGTLTAPDWSLKVIETHGDTSIEKHIAQSAWKAKLVAESNSQPGEQKSCESR